MAINSDKKKLIIRRALLGLVVYLLAFLQNGEGRFPSLFSVRAFFLIPAVVAIGMFEKEIPGILYGLFAGVLWDMVASGNNYNAIFLVIAGYISAMLITTIMRCNIATHFIITTLFLIIYSVGYWLFNYVFKGIDGAVFVLFRYYLPAIIYTCVFSPFIFLLVRFIEKKFEDESI